MINISFREKETNCTHTAQAGLTLDYVLHNLTNAKELMQSMLDAGLEIVISKEEE